MNNQAPTTDISNYSDRFPWKSGLILYILSYGYMFGFLDSFFWDDWHVNFKLTAAEAHQYWIDNLGFFPTNRFIEISLLGRNPVLFHVLTFVIFYLIPVVAFAIAKRLSLISKEQRYFFAILLLVLPINSARVSMATFRLSYSLLIFLVAWLILVHPRTARVKYLSAPLFLFSFLSQSLIPFFVLPCLHYAYLTVDQSRGKKLRTTILQFSYFFMAPLYLCFAWLLSPPVDSRRDYYTPGLSGIVRAILVLALVCSFFMWTVFRKGKDEDDQNRQLLFSISFLLLGFGSAAYIASGRLVDVSEWMLSFVPRASDWDSRHQLLLGFGIALFLSSLLVSVETTWRKQFFVGLVALCVLLNISMMQGYFFDAMKQREAVSILSKHEDIADWERVIVIDEAVVYNARNRKVRSYEWEQIIVKAGGMKGISVVTETHPCPAGEAQEPAVFLLLESNRGRFTSMIKGGVALRIQKTEVSVCF